MTINQFCFVIDNEGKQLSPTKVNKAWFLIRKNRAVLVELFPMVIKLTKTVKSECIDSSVFTCGVDIGSKHTGIAIVQVCNSRTKVVFKGTIEHRNDVKKLMTLRAGQRRYRRYHKRYRPARFNNRSSSKKNEKIAPSIKQKKDSVLRVVNYLNKYIKIEKYKLEDVAIDIRRLQDGKIYSFEYQNSNRLDENLRKATLMRDNFKCQECGKNKLKLEAHHITPKRLNGCDSISNLITLCKECHDKIGGIEEQFIEKFYKKIEGRNIRFDYAQHVMQGKTYLRKELCKLGSLELTYGSDTANKRIDLNIIKSHSNDAVVICGERVNQEQCNISDWAIRPLRKQRKVEYKEVYGLSHRDIVSYVTSKKEKIVGYITAMYFDTNQVNIQTEFKHWKRVNAKKCKLINRPNNIMWLCNL